MSCHRLRPSPVGRPRWGCRVELGPPFLSLVQIEGASRLCGRFGKFQPKSSNRAVRKAGLLRSRGHWPLCLQSLLVHYARPHRAMAAVLPSTHAASRSQLKNPLVCYLCESSSSPLLVRAGSLGSESASITASRAGGGGVSRSGAPARRPVRLRVIAPRANLRASHSQLGALSSMNYQIIVNSG